MTTDPHATLRDRVLRTVLDGPGESDPSIRRAAADGEGVPAALQTLVGRIILLAAVVLAIGCSGSAGPAALQPARDLITGEELRKADFVNVLDAIEKLRPLWLANRGPDSFTAPSEVVVYADNVKLGGVGTLRGMNIQTIRYIRHYDGRAAQARWGMGHAAGVIFISAHD